MERTYVKPPKTLLEVFEGLPEGTLAQLINDHIVMSPAPSDKHQETVGELYAQLHRFVRDNQLGKVRIAPYDVFLNGRNVYQPDIVFVANANLQLIKENGLHGAPDLVIEILSPTSSHYDKGEKKDEYERSGVREYWIVDPSNKAVEGYQLVDGEFKLVSSASGKIGFCLFDFTLSF